MAHVRVERVVWGRLTELRDHLSKPADVCGGTGRLARFQPRSQDAQVSRPLHQLEEQVAHIDPGGSRGKRFKQRFQRSCRRSLADASQRDEVVGVVDDSQHRDQILDLRPVVKSVTTDHDMGQTRGEKCGGDGARDRVGPAEDGD